MQPHNTRNRDGLPGLSDRKPCRLADVVERSTERNTRQDVRVLSISNTDGLVEQETLHGRRLAACNLTGYKTVRHGWFAYAPNRLNTGHVAYLHRYPEGVVSPIYEVFTARDNVLPGYLRQFFTSPRFHVDVCRRLEGSVRPVLTWDSFENIPLWLPCLDEQQKVTDFLLLIDRITANHRRTADALVRLLCGLRHRLFDRPQGVRRRLGDVCTLSLGESSKRRTADGKHYEMGGGAEPVARCDSCNAGPDVVTVSVGGVCGWVTWHGQRFHLGESVAMLDAKQAAEVENLYIYIYLKHREPALRRLRLGATDLKHITLADLRRFPVIVPPLRVQRSLCLPCVVVGAILDRERRILSKWESLKASLLLTLV